MKQSAKIIALASVIITASLEAHNNESVFHKIDTNIEQDLTYQKVVALKSLAWGWKEAFKNTLPNLQDLVVEKTTSAEKFNRIEPVAQLSRAHHPAD